MIKRGLLVVFTALLLTGFFNKLRAQIISNSIAIVLNEYCMGNYSISDNYGVKSDWVEILCNHTQSVSLGGYYLSNDRNNLYKWQFPNTFTLGVNGIGVVYLTGRNESRQIGANWFYHASFNINQCKNQWLILTSPQGVVRDSVFVQKTKAGHTRGRIDKSIMGIQGWRIYTVHSFSLSNPMINYYIDYLPMPTFTPQAGWGHNGETVDMFLNGSTIPYDGSDSSNCYEIHYTTNGCIPTYTDPMYTYTNSGCGSVATIILENQMYRAITLPKLPILALNTCSAYPQCTNNPNYLPSFIQTNTYFSESNGSFDAIDSRFGILSLAIDCPDTNWFRSPAAYDPVVHVEYFDAKNTTQWVEGYGAIHKPIQEAWATGQRGFYVNIDDRRGFGCNFEGPIFNNSVLGTSSRTLFPTLHVHAGDFESASSKNGNSGTIVSGNPLQATGTGIRDVFIQSLALKYNIKVNPLHMKPLILFINGRYQGAFNLREVYDWYYSSYYKGQPKDSTYLQRFHQGVDSYVDHFEDDGRAALPFNNPINRWRAEVYDYAQAHAGALSSMVFYNTLMSKLNKESFMDYHILNGYMLNSDLWSNNIAFGRGLTLSLPGERWEYYAWNMPATLNFKAISQNTITYGTPYFAPCVTYSAPYNPSPLAGNGHGTLLRLLMLPVTGNASFQKDYKNRWMDLLNGPLKCDAVLSHYDAVVDLFRKEMLYHEDLASVPGGTFTTMKDDWDTNTARLRRLINERCTWMKTGLTTAGCYGLNPPHYITVDVYPPDAGKVRLGSEILPKYVWSGEYYQTELDFKAIPTTTTYVFHHWEFAHHAIKNHAPLSLDSVAIDFNQDDQVIAYFTDITADITMPTGFSPNGDGNNDVFAPAGSALKVTDFDFRIWNRWGQEVFRSTDATIGWNGYFEDRICQTGVYAYVITYKNVYNEFKTLKGNVTLMK